MNKKNNSLRFLDHMLGRLIQPPKPPKSSIQIEQERCEKKYYQRLRRLCKKNNITYSRDMSYWDFSEPIGTIGLNEGVDCYLKAYDYVFNFLNVFKKEGLEAAKNWSKERY
jgi:hypothetical protein